VSIAQRLASQPQPGFDVTETVIGTLFSPLSLSDALLGPTTATTTDDWGVDRRYQLGLIQTWNATMTKELSARWIVLAGYTGIKGTQLDLLSAPNRGPGGTLLLAGVQPFTWESSDGTSRADIGTFQLARRLSHGLGGNVSYTVSKARDNTPSLGSGSTLVAQDPNNLNAEWALSNFDRRYQLSASLLTELPFGEGRRWLDDTGFWPGILGGWTVTAAYTAQSGTPFAARVCGAVTDVGQGTNCSLRADYTGESLQLADPSVTSFFNRSAFVAPATGLFGNSARNIITGPGGHQLNGTIVRDIRVNDNYVLTLQIRVTNLLNTVQWTTIDADVNSATYGHVLAAKPMRSATVNVRFRF
jgi:hypothetical protein